MFIVFKFCNITEDSKSGDIITIKPTLTVSSYEDVLELNSYDILESNSVAIHMMEGYPLKKLRGTSLSLSGQNAIELLEKVKSFARERIIDIYVPGVDVQKTNS